MKALFLTLFALTGIPAYADAFLETINGKEYCVSAKHELALSYEYTFKTNHTYKAVEVLDKKTGRKESFKFLGRQGSFGPLIFKNRSSSSKFGKYFFATDDRGSNNVGFIKAMDELGNVVERGLTLDMAYYLTSSYKVFVSCY